MNTALLKHDTWWEPRLDLITSDMTNNTTWYEGKQWASDNKGSQSG